MKADLTGSMPSGPTQRAVAYLPLVMVGVAIAVILILHAQSARDVVAIWNRSETFAHGFLVVPISLWLAWLRRHELASMIARPYWPGLLIGMAVGFVWLLAELGSVASVGQFAVVGLVICAVWTICGTQITATLAFPLAFLVFAVPAGEFLVPWLVERTADVTVAALRATGIPVYREANNFVIPSGEWSVVDACSGIRYLIASLVGGSLFSYLYFRSLKRRSIVIVASFVVPLVANWIRAYMIVMIGHLSNNKYGVDVDHLVYGWVLFGVVMFAFFAIAMRWREDPPESTDAARFARMAATRDDRAPGALADAKTIVGATFAVVIIAFAWVQLAAALEPDAEPARTSLVLEASAGGPAIEPAPLDGWQPNFAGSNAAQSWTVSRATGNAAGATTLYIAFYTQQRHGRELIQTENALLPAAPGPWRVTTEGTQSQRWIDRTFDVRFAELRNVSTGQRLRVQHWYWTNGVMTSNEYMGKVQIILSRLLGRGDASAAIVVHAEITADQPDPTEALNEAIATLAPRIEVMLRRATESTKR
jgi:exosortase A